MKKVRLLKEVEFDGESIKAGKILNCDENTANTLVNEGKAVAITTDGPGITLELSEEEKKQAELMQKAVDSALAEFKKSQDEILSRLPKVEVIERVDPKGGFKNFGHFCSDVRRASAGKKSEALVTYEKTIMEEGDDAQGGFLVPTEFRAALLQVALEKAIVTPRAQFIPMQTNRIEIPAAHDTDHSSNEFYGGVVIYRVSEGTQKTRSKPKFGKVELNLHEVAGLVYVSNALLEDSPISIEALLNSMFGQAIAFVMDDDFINGDGAGKPQGILNSPALVVVAKEAAQAADTIVDDNIWKMYSRLHPALRGGAVWIANINTFPQLAIMQVGDAPAWLPANGMSGKPYDTLIGLPIFFTEKAQTLGDEGDIILANLGQYLVGGKAGMNVKTDMSIHLRFDYDETAYRFVIRYDGKGWWKSALTPKYGAGTLSPFVTLAERAP